MAEQDQCSTGLSYEKFFDRTYRCYYYKESHNYVRLARFIFESTLKKYNETGRPMVELFAKEFSNRVYTGRNSIVVEDRDEFRVFCLNCAVNLDSFISKFEPTNIMDKYCHKWKVKGTIHGIINTSGNTYIVGLSFKDMAALKKDIDFFHINSYLYNATNHTNYDSVIMSVPQDGFYTIPYDENDYTIQRGFLTFNKGNKLRKRGDYCTTCCHHCKPSYFNGLERLELTI